MTAAPGRAWTSIPLYGNHVVIDTGHEHVVLAHLRPGTVSVTAGDVVRVGQLLGEVGNSGAARNRIFTFMPNATERAWISSSSA
ncbi:peptidoglycan DD-metalloendopeptidase family protein [Streptomyces sp. NPDC003233]